MFAMAEQQEAHRRTRKISIYFRIFLKTIIFNLFVIGFILNLLTLTSSEWIKGKNYVIGILKYCKSVEKSYGIVRSSHYLFFNRGSQLVHQKVDNFECYFWNDINKPSNYMFFSYLRDLLNHTTFLSKNWTPFQQIEKLLFHAKNHIFFKMNPYMDP